MTPGRRGWRALETARARPEREPQRRVGERDDAVRREADHLGAANIWSRPRRAAGGRNCTTAWRKPIQANMPRTKRSRSGMARKAVERLAIDEPEIADVAGNRRRR